VRAKDEVGNVDETPATHQFTVNVSSDDITPPVMHIVSSSDVNVSGTVTPSGRLLTTMRTSPFHCITAMIMASPGIYWRKMKAAFTHMNGIPTT